MCIVDKPAEGEEPPADEDSGAEPAEGDSGAEPPDTSSDPGTTPPPETNPGTYSATGNCIGIYLNDGAWATTFTDGMCNAVGETTEANWTCPEGGNLIPGTHTCSYDAQYAPPPAPGEGDGTEASRSAEEYEATMTCSSYIPYWVGGKWLCQWRSTFDSQVITSGEATITCPRGGDIYIPEDGSRPLCQIAEYIAPDIPDPEEEPPPGDVDDDGIIDEYDEDIDGDGIPNNEDDDIDGDGIANDEDETPAGDDNPYGAPYASVDGVCVDGGWLIPGLTTCSFDPKYNIITDIDGDGIEDIDDDDIDGDGIPNDEDDDIDGDGILNEDDDTPSGQQVAMGQVVYDSIYARASNANYMGDVFHKNLNKDVAKDKPPTDFSTPLLIMGGMAVAFFLYKQQKK
jgi:hypothetical protein